MSANQPLRIGESNAQELVGCWRASTSYLTTPRDLRRRASVSGQDRPQGRQGGILASASVVRQLPLSHVFASLRETRVNNAVRAFASAGFCAKKRAGQSNLISHFAQPFYRFGTGESGVSTTALQRCCAMLAV